jgi:hypothetical protein
MRHIELTPLKNTEVSNQEKTDLNELDFILFHHEATVLHASEPFDPLLLSSSS